jgi:hypothetical protein
MRFLSLAPFIEEKKLPDMLILAKVFLFTRKDLKYMHNSIEEYMERSGLNSLSITNATYPPMRETGDAVGYQRYEKAFMLAIRIPMRLQIFLLFTQLACDPDAPAIVIDQCFETCLDECSSADHCETPPTVANDLKDFVMNAPIIGSSGSFVKPDEANVTRFRAAMLILMQGDPGRARVLFGELDYELVEMQDTGDGDRSRYVAYEKAVDNDADNVKGHGIYVWDPEPDLPILIQSPHPQVDDTFEEALDVLRYTGAAGLLHSGAHRCSGTTDTPCSFAGGTTTCSGDGTTEEFTSADSAHNELLYFHAAHQASVDLDDSPTGIQLHAFRLDPNATLTVGQIPDPYAVISSGIRLDRGAVDSCSELASNRLQQALEWRIVGAGPPVEAPSTCPADASVAWPTEGTLVVSNSLQASQVYSTCGDQRVNWWVLSGNINPQGAYANNPEAADHCNTAPEEPPTDVCDDPPGNIDQPWIHIEQTITLRWKDDGSPG